MKKAIVHIALCEQCFPLALAPAYADNPRADINRMRLQCCKQCQKAIRMGQQVADLRTRASR